MVKSSDILVAKIGEIGESVRRIDQAISEVKSHLHTYGVDINKLKIEMDLMKQKQLEVSECLESLVNDMSDLRSDRDKVLGGFFTLTIIGGVIGTVAGLFKPFMQYVTYLITKSPTN